MEVSQTMTVLAAVDDEETADGTLTVGDDLAEAYDDDLLALHVFPQDRFEKQWHEADLNAEEAQEEAGAVARAAIDRALGDGNDARAKGRVGDVTEEIIAEAEQLDARYLVIGGRKRSPVGKALFGSITQSVLLSAPLPVVAVMEE